MKQQWKNAVPSMDNELRNVVLDICFICKKKIRWYQTRFNGVIKDYHHKCFYLLSIMYSYSKHKY